MYASNSASSSPVSRPSLARTFSSSIRAASPSGKSKAKMLSASAGVIPRPGKSNTLRNTSACGLELNLNLAILSFILRLREKDRWHRRSSERQHSGARLVRPVEGDDGALVEFGFAILGRREGQNRVLLVRGVPHGGAQHW